MSAWKDDLNTAPKDGRQVLVDHPDWACPCVMGWDGKAGLWLFSEEILSQVEGGLMVLDGTRWAPVPE